MEAFSAALEIDPSYEPAQQNLRKAYDLALQSLPHSYRSERSIWKVVAQDSEAHTKLLEKLCANCEVHLHPQYLKEVEGAAFAAGLRRIDWVMERAGGEVLQRLFETDMSVASISWADDRLRLGLHILVDALTKVGLPEIALAAAEVLSGSVRTAGETLQVAKTFNDTGVLYRRLGEFDKALYCYDRAMVLYGACKDHKFCGHVQYNRGVAYELRNHAGDRERARKAYSAAVATYEAMGLAQDAREARARLREIDAEP